MAKSRPSSSIPRGRSLGLEIATALTFKIVALAVLYFAFFGSAHRVPVTPDLVAAVFGEPAPTPGKH